MQVGDDDRHALQVVGLDHELVVLGVLLVHALHGHRSGE